MSEESIFRMYDVTAWKADPTGPVGEIRQCFCVGPQGDDPVCPCRMHAVRIENGRYLEIIDLGPAPKDKS